jgi:radical SAM family protein
VEILLVSTYELGHQPLHLASPAARLLRDGHQVHCLDLAVEDWDDDPFQCADLVAFSVPMHTAMRLAVQAATRLRTLRSLVPIAFYGLYAAMGADRRAGHVADRLIVGEYEDELASWVDDQSSGSGGKEARGAVRVDLGRKAFLPPARHLLPGLENYARLEIDGEARLAGYVEASHGCRHRCRHCPIPAVYDGRYRVTGLDTVMADVSALAAMGARHVTFGDPDFLNAPRYAMDVLGEVNSAFPDLTFDLTVKVEHILDHRDLWPVMAARNVVFVVSAFETTNDRVLGILEKGHTAMEMGEATMTTRMAGIQIRPSWMPFTPLTELTDLGDILQFLAEFDLLAMVDPVQLSIRLLIPEGSLILGSEMAPFVNDYDSAGLSYRWTARDPRVDDLQRRLAAIAEQGGSDQKGTILEMWSQALPGVPIPEWPRQRPIRLTESWFCCAEPTSGQLLRAGAGAG